MYLCCMDFDRHGYNTDLEYPSVFWRVFVPCPTRIQHTHDICNQFWSICATYNVSEQIVEMLTRSSDIEKISSIEF